MYVTVPGPCNLEELEPNMNVGVPLLLIVTVCVEVLGPLHPVDVAVIVDAPSHVAR